MAYSMKFHRSIGLICLAGWCLVNILAQEPLRKKEWRFQSAHGTLRITAMSFSSGDGPIVTRMEISPDASGTWTVAEEAVPVDSLLTNLSKEGFEMRSLASISLRLNEADSISRLAACAAKSKMWRSELKTGSPARFYPLVVSLLNESQAYKEINETFAKRGFNARVASVEKVAVEDFLKSGGKCPTGIRCANLRVPSDALIQIDVASADRH